MLLANLPSKFIKVFASGASAGNIRTVPVTTSDPNAASETLGFPPSTLTSEGAGGVPPDGRDFNGILNQITAWSQWFSSGGLVQYDPTYQGLISGYPKWAIVGSVTTPGTYWQSTADANTTNPDTGGSGWLSWPSASSTNWASPGFIGSSTPNGADFTSIFNHGNYNGNSYVNGTDLQINGVGFVQSFGSGGVPFSGYMRLPNNWIAQWGRFDSPTGTDDLINFPVTFPNNASLTSDCGKVGSSPATVNLGLKTDLSGFLATTFVSGSPTAGVGVGWIAVGN